VHRTRILKDLIEKTGLSIKKFSSEVNIPYTTLRSILDRGIGNASVDNVMKICRALEVTIEDLEIMANGKIAKDIKPSTVTVHLDSANLTEEEEKELNNYIEFLLSKRVKK